MRQVPQDALAAYLQVCGLLLRSEVSTNQIATIGTGMVALDYLVSVVGVHAVIYIIIADYYLLKDWPP
jgi:hypothetical protein